jgi:hypothetical protein
MGAFFFCVLICARSRIRQWIPADNVFLHKMCIKKCYP